MIMHFGIYLTGPFGQSQQLYQVRNDAKRGRVDEAKVTGQILQDTKTIIEKQKEAGCSFVIDPMFRFSYLFQPLAEQVSHISVGPQEHWFNNNVFYWRPQIQKPMAPALESVVGFTSKYLHNDLLPNDGTAMAILPSPYTLLMLSDVRGYQNKRSAIKDIAALLKAEAGDLVAKGFGRIQYDEPALVYKQSLGSLTKNDLLLLKRGMEVCGQIPDATTSLHTYFGDAASLLPYLFELPVTCIGIDATETRIRDIVKQTFAGKELALGIVNARNTAAEDPEEILDVVDWVATASQPDALWITPNTGTEYRGWTHGLKKVEILANVKQGYENNDKTIPHL